MDHLTCIDLFAGAGGATEGLRAAGFAVIGAVENDAAAAASYRLNQPATKLWEQDIRTLAASQLRRDLGLEPGQLTLLKACPPCQGFSTLAHGGETANNSERNDLVLDVIRFIRSLRPSAVLLENVPGLERDVRFSRMKEALASLGYSFVSFKLDAAMVGVPQRRRRLIMVAVRGRRGHLPGTLPELLGEWFAQAPKTAKEALDELRHKAAPDDALNKHRRHSPKVAARIAAVPVGGNRFDLPPEHQLACHINLRKRNATASYGRVRLDAPAPTMTTRCVTPACGSFIHPTEHRGLTLREAAAFQTFPSNYRFVGDFGSIERQIGNAVPVRMAQALGAAVLAILQNRQKGRSRLRGGR
ncbi:DNA cytosine methyltransferase [Micromonospora parathelypteridis]|uniref:DNA (cytosine-5-)-methyltransferase n=1 Tax=Micromonospora parathelypteridis TaxID=1839617 RepID=A0A840VLP3_9ACTN|nr:DNA cytosine methyltransferase [Micromonospora parathelypteridis]MBB5477657.1 DNA (cytosine-5)-methyltransferase 1 [Micromonospora parathelypteridis]GGO10978.1 cytosine-specific methyltransferase [Micromonospora parathelypteridis]